MKGQHLLLVEDEAKLREQLIELLEGHGYTVDASADGVEGFYIGSKYHYDVAVIDLGLPRMSGMEVIEKLRMEGKDYPILILTARGDWHDKVYGLEAGADDYLVKPFHVRELLARLEALIRRASGHFKPELAYGPLKLDSKSKRVRVADRKVDLTAFEFNLLEYLMLHPGDVVSKTDLTSHLYEQDFERDSNVIEVFVGRLRRKIDPGNQLKPIETVRGQGYRFSLEN